MGCAVGLPCAGNGRRIKTRYAYSAARPAKIKTRYTRLTATQNTRRSKCGTHIWRRRTHEDQISVRACFGETCEDQNSVCACGGEACEDQNSVRKTRNIRLPTHARQERKRGAEVGARGSGGRCESGGCGGGRQSADPPNPIRPYHEGGGGSGNARRLTIYNYLHIYIKT